LVVPRSIPIVFATVSVLQVSCCLPKKSKCEYGR
jgi:hypothetical protein